MPLIDLKTNLRSLKYGSDQRGGGSSDQPFIVTDIPEGNDVYPISGPDFIVRNGYLNYAVNTANDVIRLSKWFVGDLGFTGYLDKIEQKVEDLNWSNFGSVTELVKAVGGESIRGIKFTTKQNLLERQNVDVADGIGRVYNPLGTIAQVGAVSSGGHLIKQGLNFLRNGYYDGGDTGYFKFTTTANDANENRLSLLFKSKISNSSTGAETRIGRRIYDITPSSNTVDLISYSGGPGSFLGIGKTNIRIQNKTRRVREIPQDEKFQPSYISELISDNGYLTPNKKRPYVNYTYNPSFTSGSSILALNTFKPFLDDNYEGEAEFPFFTFNISNILNRNEYTSDPNLYTSSLNPNVGAPKNDNGLAYRADYKFTQNRPFINWIYNLTSSLGASNSALDTFQYRFKNDISPLFFTDDPSIYLLNRDELPSILLNKNIEALKNNQRTAIPYIYWVYPLFDSNSVSYVAYAEFRKIAPGVINELKENLLPNGLDPTFALNGRNNKKSSPYDGANNAFTFSFKKTLEQFSKGQEQNTAFLPLGDPGDFRSAINTEFDDVVLPSTDYSEFNREKTYQDSITTYYGNYGNGKRILNPNIAVSMDQNEVGVMGEDIVDFNFTLILNNNPSNDQNRLIDFKAYIESWNDSTQGEWNEIKYMGRAEKLYKYNGFSRAGSVTFLVPALSRGDMIANYRKLNALMWATAPSYSDSTAPVSGLMRGSLVNFTMGNYFRRMPCIIKSINYTEIDGMGWDINRTESGLNIEGDNELYVGQLPKGIKVQVDFIPLHNFVPQYGEAFIGQNAIYSPPKTGKSIWKTDDNGSDKNKTISGMNLPIAGVVEEKEGEVSTIAPGKPLLHSGTNNVLKYKFDGSEIKTIRYTEESTPPSDKPNDPAGKEKLFSGTLGKTLYYDSE